MKTFLHYTKQKELDEGFMSALGGVASGVVRGAKRVGGVVSNVASALSSEKAQSIGAMLGGKTGKFSDAIKVFGDMKEKQTKEKGQLAGDKADCVRRLNYYQQLLNNARSRGSPDGKIVAEMNRIKSECAGVMKASAYDELAKQREKENNDIIADFNKQVAGKKGFDKYG